MSVKTTDVVREVILANESRFRQNGKVDFESDYALTYVAESVAGAESTRGYKIPKVDVLNILRLNQALWEDGDYNRTSRIKTIVPIFGTIRTGSKASAFDKEELMVRVSSRYHFNFATKVETLSDAIANVLEQFQED